MRGMSMHEYPDPGPEAPRERLRRYLAATAAMGPSWRADGRALAFIWNESGSHQVYVAELGPAVRIVQVGRGTDRSTDPRFLSTGELIYTSDSGGNENFQLMLATPAGTAAGTADAGTAHAGGEWTARRLTSDDAAKYRVVGLSDAEILFVGNDADRSRFTLYAQPLPLNRWEPRELITPERGVIQRAVRLPEGRVVVELAYGNMSQELILLPDPSAGTRSLTRDLDDGADVRWHLIRPTQDGDLLASTDLNADRMRPVLLGMDGTITLIPCLEEMAAGELEHATYRDELPGAMLELNVEGYSRLYRLTSCTADAELQPLELPYWGTLVAGDARTSRVGLALSPDACRLAVAFGGPARVSNIWVTELPPASGTAPSSREAPAGPDRRPLHEPDGETPVPLAWQRLTHAAVPGIQADELVDCTLSRFQSFDGLSVPYFTYLPRVIGTAGAPAVLMIHGGPEAQTRPAFNNVVQFLVAAGFAVIVPNVRGSAGYGRRYLDLDNREQRLDAIRDIAELARRLDGSHDEIDASRLAVMGASYGGFAVLSSLTEYPELWKAGVDIVGISNFVTFLTNTAAWRRSLRESEYGSLEDRELLERISPINRIEQIRAPLLIIQGDNDERVPLSESIQMHDRLRELGRSVELMRFPDEGHGVTRLENRVTAYTRVVEWLEQHV